MSTLRFHLQLSFPRNIIKAGITVFAPIVLFTLLVTSLQAAPRGDRRSSSLSKVGDTELIGERDSRTRKLQREDGTLRQEIAVSPLHYRDEGGTWRPIRLDIRESSDGGFSNDTNLVMSRYPGPLQWPHRAS